jgi:glycerate kinase
VGVAERALLAPDSFKGTLSAATVAGALASGFEEVGWEVDRCPLADGGEGTGEVLIEALGGEWREVEAHDPLGRPIRASFALVDRRRMAVVETAAASGLHLVAEHERDPESASSAGTGELLVAAARSAGTVLLGVGGSATTDGGAGATAAIDAGGGLGAARLVCLCDVRTPWEDAARTFAPQKGAGGAEVARLSERMERLARELPRDPRGQPMTGAAGGLAGGLWARFGAELVPGAAFVLDAVGFDRRADRAALVVTGEGRLDATTLEGKVAGEVARRCRHLGVAVHAVAGEVVDEPDLPERIGLDSVHPARTEDDLRAVARALAVQSRVTG